MIKTIVIFFLCTSISVASMISRTKISMGTFLTISLNKSDKKHFNSCFNIMKEVDNSISSYKSSSPIYKLNKDNKATINNLTYEALLLSKIYYKKTNEYFDITIGSITKDLYKFGEDEKLPNKFELNNSIINFNNLKFNEQNAYLKKGTKVDLGGMGKGFGVDKISKYLKSNAVKKAIIAASGDIRCLSQCTISVQNPFHENILLSFRTTSYETGITTSGNYNRYVKSKENNHLINPKEKKSQDKFASITLISKIPNSDLDAYATAASVMPKKVAYDFLNSLDLAYIIVETNKSLHFSKNISEYTKELSMNDTTKK